MPAAFVQSARFDTDFLAHASIPVTFLSNITPGNCVACGVYWANITNTLTGATGSSDTYTVNEFNLATGPTITSARILNSVGGYKIVTLTFNASFTGSQQAICHEISGVNAIDTGHAGTSTPSPPGTDNITSGNFTTTANGDYVFGFTVDNNATGGAVAGGTGFTRRENSTGFPMVSEDLIQASAGTVAATFSDSTASTFPQFFSLGFAFKTPVVGVLPFEDDSYNVALITQPDYTISVW